MKTTAHRGGREPLVTALVTLLLALAGGRAEAGIPEPDAVFYGVATKSGVLLGPGQQVSVLMGVIPIFRPSVRRSPASSPPRGRQG